MTDDPLCIETRYVTRWFCDRCGGRYDTDPGPGVYCACGINLWAREHDEMFRPSRFVPRECSEAYCRWEIAS